LDKKIILLILLVAVASSLGTAYSLGGTNIIFRTSPDGISSNEVMRITSDQKVGINTTNPQTTLDVNGDLNVNGPISSPTTTYLLQTTCFIFNRYADLSYCNLSDLGLYYLDLAFTNLSYAYLVGTDFTGTNLIGADLTGADLTGADLTDSYLAFADLIGANLSGANLSGADLFFANLDNANLEGANFQDADLTVITSVGCIGTPVGTPAFGSLPVCS
jgi:hypothetical protein